LPSTSARQQGAFAIGETFRNLNDGRAIFGEDDDA
jgi:hypothetical protein